jgi:IclR helix-turn-helix domain
VSTGDHITITLSPLQVEQVIHAAGQGQRASMASLLLAALNGRDACGVADVSESDHERPRTATQEALEAAMRDPQLSQSLLRGLAVISCYGPERPWRAVIDLAHELDMSPSTTHRYVKTLRAVGLLEQHPTTREYRPVAM